MKNTRRNIASVHYALFDAIQHGLYRFENAAQAEALLRRISHQFVLCKEQDANGIKLWVRGFAVTEAEKEQGFKGHFALLRIVTLESGKVTIEASKCASELATHPEKERVKHHHPNMSHPILKAIQKNGVYAHIADARDDLMSLHEEFPTVSTPGRDKLFIMVYVGEAKPPVKKMILTIKAAEGGYRLHLAENTKPKKPPSEAKKPGAKKGKFTSMVALQGKKPN